MRRFEDGTAGSRLHAYIGWKICKTIAEFMAMFSPKVKIPTFYDMFPEWEVMDKDSQGPKTSKDYIEESKLQWIALAEAYK